MALLIVQGSFRRDARFAKEMKRPEWELTEPVLTQRDGGELLFTVCNGFDVPIKVTKMRLVDEPTASMLMQTRDVPEHDALHPGQSLKMSAWVETSGSSPAHYSFKAEVSYEFLPTNPGLCEMHFEVVSSDS